MGNDHSNIQHEPINPYLEAMSARSKRKPESSSSAMKRSRSIKHANGLLREDLSSQESSLSSNSQSTTTRYIPNMTQGGNGLIMPTRPYGPSTASHPNTKNNGLNGSETSPQWGWYITTTPPPREMYHSRSRSYGGNHHMIPEGSDVMPLPYSPDPKRCQNPIFQNLQSSNQPMGWTSVPI